MSSPELESYDRLGAAWTALLDALAAYLMAPILFLSRWLATWPPGWVEAMVVAASWLWNFALAFTLVWPFAALLMLLWAP